MENSDYHQQTNMRASNRPFILIAEDDEEDRMLTCDALQECGLLNSLHFVEDGEQLLYYLLRKGEYNDNKLYPMPGLILLDLNMPRKDGREALREIKENPALKLIPIIVLTTSKAEEDIIKTYNLGVNSFITKPVTFAGLVDVMKTLNTYWFKTVRLPDLTET
jgi:CheY-like chemotaxis protein